MVHYMPLTHPSHALTLAAAEGKPGEYGDIPQPGAAEVVLAGRQPPQHLVHLVLAEAHAACVPPVAGPIAYHMVQLPISTLMVLPDLSGAPWKLHVCDALRPTIHF